MELGKPSAFSIGAWIALVLIIGYLVWQSTTKENTENYTRGASKQEETFSPVQNFFPLSWSGCAPQQKIDADRYRLQEKKK